MYEYDDEYNSDEESEIDSELRSKESEIDSEESENSEEPETDSEEPETDSEESEHSEESEELEDSKTLKRKRSKVEKSKGGGTSKKDSFFILEWLDRKIINGKEIGSKLFGNNFNINEVTMEQSFKIKIDQSTNYIKDELVKKQITESNYKKNKETLSENTIFYMDNEPVNGEKTGKRLFGNDFNIEKVTNIQSTIIRIVGNKKLYKKVTKMGKDLFGMNFDVKRMKDKQFQRLKSFIPIEGPGNVKKNELYVSAIDFDKIIYHPKILWGICRDLVIKSIGEEEYNKLNNTKRKENIIRKVFNMCSVSQTIEDNYNKIMNDTNDISKYSWIEHMKLPIENGGRARIIGTFKKSIPPMENIYNIIVEYNGSDDPNVPSIYRNRPIFQGIAPLSKKDANTLYSNLDNHFEIMIDKDGNKTIKVVDKDEQLIALRNMVSAIDLNNNDDVDNLISKLTRLKTGQEKQKKPYANLSESQINGLLKLCKYKSSEAKKFIEYNAKNTGMGFNKNVDDQIKLGYMDPDYDPSVVGVTGEYWNPFVTPQTHKQRYDRTIEVFKTVRTGTRVYILPEVIEIDSKQYMYIRRFFDFYDYLKAYQLMNGRLLERSESELKLKMKSNSIDEQRRIKNLQQSVWMFGNRIQRIKMYFDYMYESIKCKNGNVCDKELEMKLKIFKEEN